MKKQLGELLVEREWLTREQLHQALKHQQVFGGRLGTCLLELALLNEDRLGKALAEQLGAPLASADDLRVIDEGILELIPAKLACRAKVVPFERYGNSVSVAMLDTSDLMLQDELGFVVSKRLRVHVASEIRILEALEKHYHCGVEPRFGRIWDRLNRSRFLWQDEGTSGAIGPGRRPAPEVPAPTRPAAPASWQPAPPPPLESGIGRLSAAGVAASAATRPAAAATTEVMPPPPSPPPPAPAPRAAPAEAPVPAPLRAAPPASVAVPPQPAAMQPPPPPPHAAPPAAPAAPRRAPVFAAPPVPAPPAPAAAPTPAAALTPPGAPATGPTAAPRRPVRDDEATSPLVLPQPTGTLEELRRRLEDVDERDDVAHAALTFLERRVPRRLLFMVRGSQVAAWMGSGEGVDQRALADLSFGFDEPSLFLNLREGSPFYRGPLARLEAHQRLVKAWGGKYPRECLVLPVRVQKRLVAVVYCDRGTEGLSGVDMEELQEMAAALGRALESFLRRKKGAR